MEQTFETFYIAFLNKAKNFREDRIEFETYEQAINWGRSNISNFNLDMIKISY
jgi:hypothetical protein